MSDDRDTAVSEEVTPKNGIKNPVTRRGFLGAASLGAAGIGLAATIPGFTLVAEAKNIPPADIPAAASSSALVVQVKDIRTGEMSLMSGNREVIVKDRRLVAQIMRAMPR